MPLEIETGRFRSIILEDRTCKICNDGQVESEVHFILLCKHYATSRSNFFEKININLLDCNPDDLFRYLCEENPRAFSKYCSLLYTLLKDALFEQNKHEVTI